MSEHKTAPKGRSKRNKEFLEWMDALVLSILLLALLFTFVVRPLRVDGSSMLPNFVDGERVLAWQLGYTPEHGDVVVLDAYTPHGKTLIKRVIGVAGDTIDIDFQNGIVYRNGEALVEPYTAEPTFLYEGLDFPVTVPEGCIFVMGDNRNNSRDSRDSDIGCVDVRDVLGKVVFRLSPLNKIGVIS